MGTDLEIHQGQLAETGEVPRETVDALQDELSKLPQAIGMETDHFFMGGMYCRKFFLPAGILVVSKVHKTDHLFVGCSGELLVWGQGEKYTLRSGDVVPSPAGTKRVVYARGDCVVMTIHKTDVTNVDDLEEELIEPDDSALFDVNNRPKDGVLTMALKELEGK